MGKIITFGELMLRLEPLGNDRLLQAQGFQASYGGGEANVAVSLASFGKEAHFVTKLPAHEMGQAAVNELRKYGVQTQHILRGGKRIGIYYSERGASQRPSKVIYDRESSAIAEAKSSEFNWKEIFDGAEWFHFTGITPALSDNCAQICLEAARAANNLGLTVSIDLNYRNKLWDSDKAQQIMTSLMQYCHVLIGNEEDADKIFGIKADATDIYSARISEDSYQKVAHELLKRFQLKLVAITLRESHSASCNGWSAILYDGLNCYHSKKYEIQIVDRVGGGDSFGAGLIYGLTSNKDMQWSLDFAVASSCLKHTIKGDFNMVSINEVELLMKGDASGRVQR